MGSKVSPGEWLDRKKILNYPYRFYRDASGQATLKEHGFMIEWAQRAGKLVFQEVEDLDEDNIVTFLTLGLFWHSQGAWRTCYLYKGFIKFHDLADIL